jgi:sodium/potassium-transporting ATPase subunit alpha
VIMIGNVPQGLPTTVTACLFIVAESMGKQNVFVKKLDVIETLGSCTLICTDKTGTLTLNVMSVANMWFFDRKSSQDEFSAAASAARGDKANHQLFALLNVAVLNSRVVLEKKTEDSEAIPTGGTLRLIFIS